jgi:hypothetical protein
LIIIQAKTIAAKQAQLFFLVIFELSKIRQRSKKPKQRRAEQNSHQQKYQQEFPPSNRDHRPAGEQARQERADTGNNVDASFGHGPCSMLIEHVRDSNRENQTG